MCVMRKALLALITLAALGGAVFCLETIRDPLPVAAGQVYVNTANDRRIEILEVGPGHEVAQHFKTAAQNLKSLSDIEAGGIVERLEVQYDPMDADTQVVAYREKVWTTTLQDVQPWELGERVRKRVEVHRVRLLPVHELEAKYERIGPSADEFWTWDNFSRAVVSDVYEVSDAFSGWMRAKLVPLYSNVRTWTSGREEEGSHSGGRSEGK